MNSILEKLLGRQLTDKEKNTLSKKNYNDGGVVDELTNAYRNAAQQGILGTQPQIEADPDSNQSKFKHMQDYTGDTSVDVRTPEQKQRAEEAAKQYGYNEGGIVNPEKSFCGSIRINSKKLPVGSSIVKKKFAQGGNVQQNSVVQPHSPISILRPNLTPPEIVAKLQKENNGHVGGTIRDGSKDEIFVVGPMIFSVAAAKEISQGQTNGSVVCSNDWSNRINVEEDHAIQADSTNPVMIAQIPLEDGSIAPLLFDGHHRMYRAMSEGQKNLPAYIFTPEQSLAIMSAPPDLMYKLRSNIKGLKNNKSQMFADGGDVLPQLNFDANKAEENEDQPIGTNTVLRGQQDGDENQEDTTDDNDTRNGTTSIDEEEPEETKKVDQEDNEDEEKEESVTPASISSDKENKTLPPSLNFSGRNLGDLAQLLAERRKDLSTAQINKGLEQFGAGLARINPNLSDYQEEVKKANLPIEDYMMMQKNEANDPKSGISQGMRDYMNQQLGVNVSPDATAAQIGQVAPMVLKQLQAKQAQAARSADLAQRLKEKQMEVASRNQLTQAFREKSSADKQTKADTDRLDKMSKAVTAEVATGRSAFGQAARNAQSIQNAQALLNGETDPNNLDNRQVFELTRTLDRVLSQAGGTVAGSEHLTPDTARGRLAKLMEFITNKRQGAQAGSFIKTFSSTLDREANQAQKQIASTQKSMLSSYKDLQNKYPDRFNDILNLHGISPDMLNPDQQNAPSVVAPTPKTATGGGGIQVTPDMQAQAQAEIARRKKAQGQ